MSIVALSGLEGCTVSHLWQCLPEELLFGASPLMRTFRLDAAAKTRIWRLILDEIHDGLDMLLVCERVRLAFEARES